MVLVVMLFFLTLGKDLETFFAFVGISSANRLVEA